MVRLLFCGDFVCQSPGQIKLDESFDNLIKTQDFSFINFEAPISGVGSPIIKSGPALTQSPGSPSTVEKLGFNVIGLANNHMMDMGADACISTISQFKKATVLGAGDKGGVYQVKKVKVNDITLGFLAVTHKEFGTLDDEASDDVCGTAWISSSTVNISITEAKKECDYLFVLPHAGVENVDVPLPEWRLRYKEFVDLGADAVIASHPHVPQGWEVYKDAPIFYSLGNFIFDTFSSTHGPYWKKGLAVQICIDDVGKLSYEVLNTIYDNRVLSLDTSKDIKNHNRYLCSLLENEQEYYQELNQSLAKLWRDEYKLYLLRGLGSVGLKTSRNTFIHAAYGLLKGMDAAMLLNNFQCESHRWTIERILRNKLK